MVEGGGASPYVGIKVYILLVLRGFHDAHVQALADEFKSTVKLTNRYTGGEIIDVTTDSRLKDSLVQSWPGRELFSRIEAATPVVCVSSHYVGDPNNSDKVTLLPFADFSQNHAALFRLIDTKLAKEVERSALVEFLTFVNKVAKLKPGIAGVSVDLNELITQWIVWLNRKSA